MVAFDSKSGYTETMGLAVAKGAEKAGNLEVTVKKAEETKNSDLLAVDGIILGLPTYFGQMWAKLKAVIDEFEKIQRFNG